MHQIRELAARYAHSGGGMPDMSRVRERGFYTRDEFLGLTVWKDSASRLRLDENDGRLVEGAARAALGSTHERMKTDSLLSLKFVDWPIASLLLHAADRRD